MNEVKSFNIFSDKVSNRYNIFIQRRHYSHNKSILRIFYDLISFVHEKAQRTETCTEICQTILKS